MVLGCYLVYSDTSTSRVTIRLTVSLGDLWQEPNLQLDANRVQQTLPLDCELLLLAGCQENTKLYFLTECNT